MTLENGDVKAISDMWSKYLRKYKGKTRKDRKSGEVFTDNANIPGLSSNTVDFYTTFYKTGEDSEMTVWCDLGGVYLQSELHNESMTTLNTMLDEFSLQVKQHGIETNLKSQEVVLKKMNNDMNGLVKDKENLEADIVRYEKKIEEARQKIEENILAQEMKTKEIQNQQGVVEDVKSSLLELKN